MALSIVQGDVLAAVKPGTILVHGCNMQGKMKSGFAAKLRDKHPDAYRVYKQAYDEGKLKLGEINGYVDTGRFMIVNAVTQQFYGRDKDVVYVDYDAVRTALTSVANYAKQTGGKVILPFIGGGLANGDRETLQAIFEEAFAEVDATLYIN